MHFKSNLSRQNATIKRSHKQHKHKPKPKSICQFSSKPVHKPYKKNTKKQRKLSKKVHQITNPLFTIKTQHSNKKNQSKQSIKIGKVRVSQNHSKNKTKCLLAQSNHANYSVDYDELLIKSTEKGDLKGVMECVNNGGNMNTFNDQGFTPLHISLEPKLYFPSIAKYLIKNGANYKVSNPYGEDPLYLAVYGGNCNMVKYLLNKGAKPKIIKYDDGIRNYTTTHLHCAVYYGYFNIFKVLMQSLNSKNNQLKLINFKDSRGYNLFDLSISAKENFFDERMVKWILECGKIKLNMHILFHVCDDFDLTNKRIDNIDMICIQYVFRNKPGLICNKQNLLNTLYQCELIDNYQIPNCLLNIIIDLIFDSIVNIPNRIGHKFNRNATNIGRKLNQYELDCNRYSN